MPIVSDFADAFIARASGSATDQAILVGKRPYEKFYIGMVFSKGYSGQGSYKHKIAPNLCWCDFVLEGKGPFKLKATLSSNLYFQTRIQLGTDGKTSGELQQLYATQGDVFSEEQIFAPWRERVLPDDHEAKVQFEEVRDKYVAKAPKPMPKEEMCYIRKRFSAATSIELDEKKQSVQHVLDGEFEAFRKAFSYLGVSPKWKGTLASESHITPDGNTAVRISWINTNEDERRGPSYFDAAIRVEIGESRIVTRPCPVLGEGADVTATASGLSLEGMRSNESTLIFRPFGRAQTSKDFSRRSPEMSFKHVADDVEASLAYFVKELDGQGLRQQLLDILKNYATAIKKDPAAKRALSLTSEVFDKSFEPGSRWSHHQLACVLITAGKFLQGGLNLGPIVLNVPTAGGKTEAFLASALWCSFYELQKKRRVVNIIKYPMTLLSSDQVRRISGYMMIADEITKRIEPKGYPLALGYFVGRKGMYSGPADIVKTCPYPVPKGIGLEDNRCGQVWQQSDHKQSVCKSGHILNLYCDDPVERYVIKTPPSVVLGTLDKFVSGASQKDIGLYFGGQRYHCPQHGVVGAVHIKSDNKGDRCWKWVGDNKGTDGYNNSRCGKSTKKLHPLTAGIVVFDEGHLIRERDGSINAHFESMFFELTRLNSGRYPVPIVSTATISGIASHMHQLGLGNDPASGLVILPEAEDFPAFFERTSELKHEVLAVVPQDVLLEFAVPDLLDVYFETLRIDFGFNACDLAARGVNDAEYLRQVMLYANQYKLINHTREMVQNKVNKDRLERLGPGFDLKYRQLSRKYFEVEPMEEAIKNVKEQNQQIIFATNIASIGIDIDNLDSIFFFGLPSNVSEFIQTLNRTGRRENKPAFCLCILGPNRPRDMSYYTFWDLFISRSNLIVEPIPINRFARNAASKTFNNVTAALMLMYYGYGLGENFIRANALKSAFKGNRIDKGQALEILQRSYRSADDPSHKYPTIVEELWLENFLRKIEDEPHEDSEYLSNAFGSDWMSSLRDIRQEVILDPGPSVSRLKRTEKGPRGYSIATADVPVADAAEAEDDAIDKTDPDVE
jgi:hypothetical protein